MADFDQRTRVCCVHWRDAVLVGPRHPVERHRTLHGLRSDWWRCSVAFDGLLLVPLRSDTNKAIFMHRSKGKKRSWTSPHPQ